MFIQIIIAKMINQTKISETRNGIALQIQTWNSSKEWGFRSRALNEPEWKMRQKALHNSHQL